MKYLGQPLFQLKVRAADGQAKEQNTKQQPTGKNRAPDPFAGHARNLKKSVSSQRVNVILGCKTKELLLTSIPLKMRKLKRNIGHHGVKKPEYQQAKEV